jgi:hypothetical protein
MSPITRVGEGRRSIAELRIHVDTLIDQLPQRRNVSSPRRLAECLASVRDRRLSQKKYSGK